MQRRDLALLIALVGATPFAGAAQKAVVVVPVADLRSDQSLPTPGVSDDKQQTQLLFGETVKVVRSSGDWVYVNAIEQPEFTTHQKWEGYPGWVLRSTLQLGASKKLTPPHKPGTRSEILEMAAKLISTPYTWGGLSTVDPTGKTRLTGIDCSGLIHLAYRLNGIMVPRDSMEQYMKADKIHRKDLKPADLIFSSKTDNPKKITHVALYVGADQIIEAPQAGMAVRQVSFKEKYGKDLSQVESGDTVGERVIYFGRLLKD